MVALGVVFLSWWWWLCVHVRVYAGVFECFLCFFMWALMLASNVGVGDGLYKRVLSAFPVVAAGSK